MLRLLPLPRPRGSTLRLHGLHGLIDRFNRFGSMRLSLPRGLLIGLLLGLLSPALQAQSLPDAAPAGSAPTDMVAPHAPALAPAPDAAQHEAQPAAGAVALSPSATPRSGRIDTNGDGQISREEARQNTVLHQHFDAIDTDHDGQLTLEEIRNFKAPRSHATARKGKSAPRSKAKPARKPPAAPANPGAKKPPQPAASARATAP